MDSPKKRESRKEKATHLLIHSLWPIPLQDTVIQAMGAHVPERNTMQTKDWRIYLHYVDSQVCRRS